MISPIAVLSFETRPVETAPKPAGIPGSSFADRLARAGEDRSRSGEQKRLARSEDSRKAEEAEGETDRRVRVKDETKAEETRKEGSAQKEKESPKAEDEHSQSENGRGNDESKRSTEKAENSAATRTETKDLKSGKPETAEKEKTAAVKHAEERTTEKRTANETETEQTARNAEGTVKPEVSAEVPRAFNFSEDNSLKNEQQSKNEAGKTRDLSERDGAQSLDVILKNVNRLAENGFDKSSVNRQVEGRKNKLDDAKNTKAGDLRIRNEGSGKTDRPTIQLVNLRGGGGEKNVDSGEKMTGFSVDKGGVSLGGARSVDGGETVARQEVLILDSNTGKPESAAARFEAKMPTAAADLAKALKEGGNAEILKKAQFILKDRDQGEIRLILKPERLGEVRIQLNLSDRHIAGRIIVENNSVKEAFQENMEALNRAFKENGFDSARLDVSVGNGREGSSKKGRHRAAEGIAAVKNAQIFDEQMPRVEEFVFGDGRVNVYV